MKIREKIFKKEEPPKEEPKMEAIYISTTDWPGVSMMDMLSEYAMLEPLNKAYWFYHNVSIVTDITKTITDEIFRNGLEWDKRFVKTCSLCGYKLTEDADICPICDSDQLIEPDARQQMLYYRPDGKTYLEYANNFGQSLTAVLETMSIHLEVANRGVLLVTKTYELSPNGDINLAIPDEIIALDPRYVFPVFDPRSGRMGDGSRTCIYCSERKKLSEKQVSCPTCGKHTHLIMYRTQMPQSPEIYFIDGEILMVSKYGYELFGFPILLNAEDDVFLYYFLEKRPRLFYERAKSPGILFIPTNNPRELTNTWKTVSDDLENDPYKFPVMGIPPDTPKSAEFLKLMEDPSTDHIAIKTDALRRIGSLYGIAPLWSNDTSTSGGLNNESQQLTISNRAFERGQRLFNDDVLPWLSLQLGITDYALKLKPSEDADELRDEQLLSAKLDNVQKALQVGLTVEWKNGELEISGTPKLQEQTNEPIGIPDIPAVSGEIAKSGNTYNYYGTSEKSCPPGEHEHQDFPYCHPTDRKHRDGNSSSSDPAADPSTAADNSNLIASLKDLQAKLPKSEVKLSETKFTKINYYDADQFFVPTFTRPVTDDEKKAIKSYTDSSGMINGVLDSENIDNFVKDNNLSEDQLQTISNEINTLDSAIEDTILHESITVYRGVDGMEMFGTTDYSSLLFKTKIRKAFNSTSINHGVAVDFALSNERVKHPAMLVLRVPAGKGVGMYVREFGGEYGGSEYEFLMKRNTKYIITKVTSDGRLPVIEAVVVE